MNQVIIFIGDLFDNCFEYLNIFEELIQEMDNTTIILLSLPGQAYTVFDEQRVYDNLSNCELVDRLLYDLDEKGTISTKNDNFKFIGIGLGGFVL